MNANLFAGEGDAQDVVDAVRSDARGHPRDRGDHPRRAGPAGRGRTGRAAPAPHRRARPRRGRDDGVLQRADGRARAARHAVPVLPGPGRLADTARRAPRGPGAAAGLAPRPRPDPVRGGRQGRRPDRRRHERHPRPRRDARAGRRRVPRRRRAGQQRLAADLAGQPREHLPPAAAAGQDRPRAARRHPGLARHPHRRHRRLRPPGPGRDGGRDGERRRTPPSTRRTPSSTAGTARGGRSTRPGSRS